MKFVMLLLALTQFCWAKDCSKLNIELLGEVKFLQFHKDKKVKASKFFRLPASWNDSSNNFHSLVIKSNQTITHVKVDKKECLGCTVDKNFAKNFKVKFQAKEDYLVDQFLINDHLNNEFIYPGRLSFSLYNENKLICSQEIKLEKIK